jgi:methyl-accepting chemotaxis protein
LGEVLNEFINAEFERTYVKDIVVGLKEGVEKTSAIVDKIMHSTQELKKLQNKQKILSLNANIEAARAGDQGKGFAVVASEVGKLSENSSVANERIESLVQEIAQVVRHMHDEKKFELLMKE